MLVWESFLGWPFLRKQTSGGTVLHCLTFSSQLLAAQLVLLQGLLFWGGWAYLLFGFCLLLWSRLIFWYLLRLWFSFLRAQEQGKQLGFLVVFTFFDWVAYGRIFFLKVPWRGLLTLMVIFRAWKDKTRVWDFRKEKSGVGREISWKRDVGSWGLLCQARVGRGLGQQSQWRTWGA